MKNAEDAPIILSEESIKDKIYTIRGQRVMLDVDLAKIYGYTTKTFNQQVKNNIQKFDEDFRFQLTKEEAENLRSKFLTSSWGGARYLPHAFTEQGIYMLMTVLKGDLATRQSKSLIRLFKRMKDYLSASHGQIGRQEFLRLAMQTQENTDSIRNMKTQLQNTATKDDLANFMQNFMDVAAGKEYLFMAGQIVEASVAYSGIYKQAQKSIYIVDNYIGLKSLLLLKGINKSVTVTIFSDNIGNGLSLAEYDEFHREYPHVHIVFKKTGGKYHDRFIVLDYGQAAQRIFHCGGSSKDGGKRTTAISEMDDMALYAPMINDLQKNSALRLR